MFFLCSTNQTHSTYLSSEIFSPYRDRDNLSFKQIKATELPPNHLQMALTPAEKLLKEVNLSLTRQRVAVLELF